MDSNNLTERESNVLFYLAKGLTNEEIAEKLHISIHTVKAHLESIYDKLDVSNRIQAVIKALRFGWIDLNTLV